MSEATSNLSKGSALKNAIGLSWPMLVTYFLQLTVSLVDLKMIGSLGTPYIAAIGISQQFILLIFLIFTTVTVGASIYLSQYTGRDDLPKIRETVIQTILLSILIGFVITGLSLIFTKPLLSLMNAEEQVVSFANTYIAITLYFAPVLILNYTLNSIFLATGDSKTPLLIMLLVNILNVIFNYALIFGIWIFPEMKIAGAALGTGLSRVIGVIMSFGILYKRGLLFEAGKLKEVLENSVYIPRFATMRRIFTLGFPSTLQDVSWGISMIVIYKILSMMPHNTEALSAFTIGFNVEGICIIPGIAFMQTATILVGQNMGANQIAQARKVAWLNTIFGSSLMALLGFPLAIFPDHIMSFFTKEHAVIEMGRVYLILMGATQLFTGLRFVLTGAIKGFGDTKTPFYIDFIEHWIFKIPLIVTFVVLMSYHTNAIWLIMALSNILSAVATLIIFRTGYWKKVKII